MTVGRPPKYKTPEDMQKAIDEFFEICKPLPMRDENNNIILTAKGTPAIELNPPTITGLALHLGFSCRQSMYEYEQKPEFTDTIKNARTRCENYAEKAGLSGTAPPAMAIFVLKNYGWTDKQELTADVTAKISVEYID